MVSRLRPTLATAGVSLALLAACAGPDSSAYAQQADPPPAADSARCPMMEPDVDRSSRLFPGTACSREYSEPFPYLVFYDGEDSVLGYRVDSDLAGTTADGFIGPVPVRVWFDGEGSIAGIDIVANEETPSYVDFVLNDGLLDRLLEYPPGSGDTVDAVTLATFTSNAVIGSVTATADLLAGLLATE